MKEILRSGVMTMNEAGKAIWRAFTLKIKREGGYCEEVARKLAYHQTVAWLEGRKCEPIDIEYEYDFITEKWRVAKQIITYKRGKYANK